MKRDRLTFAMIIGIPLIQLLLFGFAINMDPKKMPTVMVMADESVLTRQLIVGFQNSKYFKILDKNKNQKEADELLRRGDVQFVFYFPPDFTTKLIRGDKPELLVEADATDPAATSSALTAVSEIVQLFSANLAVGLTFSALARNQLQAMQLSFFFFLTSILLSGFMFPFQGMPEWAQVLGSALPLTHFLMIVRGIMLKGNGFFDILPSIVAIFLFLIIVMMIGMKYYRQTLD